MEHEIAADVVVTAIFSPGVVGRANPRGNVHALLHGTSEGQPSDVRRQFHLDEKDGSAYWS